LVRVVGVAADVQYNGSPTRRLEELYLPFEAKSGLRAYVLGRSTRLTPAELTRTIFEQIRAAAPDVPIEHAYTMGDMLDRPVAEPRFQASLVGAFSLNALLLAAIGVFGSVAYALSSRRRELGVRAAVGASPNALSRAVVSSTAVALMIGLTLGLAAAVALGHVLAGQIHGVAPYDPAILALSAAVLALSAMAAAAAPARNASRIDPIEALRHD
jgi:ABC-type antimicrobial peptide transport system permease subunit